ncbi:conjugal transfer protein TraD [Escherichia coli]|uniref:conjugal transfer protein TraD n=1 Tax=Escherichia coli TaxID=562 RepID=UPI000AC583B3|nr:conjugal transfer protein TraD [Escherichia coli]
MASYHCTVKTGAKGVALKHADYISRSGEYKNYKSREDLEFSSSGNMPSWAKKNPAEKAAAAKARVTAIIAAERKAAARAERKARDHELYKAAGLMIVAGLVDSKTGKPKFSAAELVGALAGIAELPRNHPKWQEWEKRGKELLTKDSA